MDAKQFADWSKGKPKKRIYQSFDDFKNDISDYITNDKSRKEGVN